jgi:hypothetical protein
MELQRKLRVYSHSSLIYLRKRKEITHLTRLSTHFNQKDQVQQLAKEDLREIN